MKLRTLLLLAVTLVIAGCGHGSGGIDTLSWSAHNPCLANPGGDTDKNHPVVCVDYDTLAPSFDPVTAAPGATVKFYYTTQKGKLRIEFPANLKITHGASEGDDNDNGDVDPSQGRDHGKYSIVDKKTGRRNDPEILIEP